MLTIETNRGIRKFPTTFDAITPEMLEKITAPITLGNNKIALVLFKLCDLYKYSLRVDSNGKIIGRGDSEVSVIPFIAKIKSNDCDYKIGDVAVIAVSDIERAHHITAHINPSEADLLNAIANNTDFRKAIIRKEVKDDMGENVTSAIVASVIVTDLYNIHASIPLHYKVED